MSDAQQNYKRKVSCVCVRAQAGPSAGHSKAGGQRASQTERQGHSAHAVDVTQQLAIQLVTRVNASVVLCGPCQSVSVSGFHSKNYGQVLHLSTGPPLFAFQ